MQYATIDKHELYAGMVDAVEAIPPDVGWYGPEGVNVVPEIPPTDEPGRWKHIIGGWVEYTAEDAKQARIAEIKSRLLEIDLESVRPLRAKAYGTATQEDDEKLAALEQEAEAVRAELAGLSG